MERISWRWRLEKTHPNVEVPEGAVARCGGLNVVVGQFGMKVKTYSGSSGVLGGAVLLEGDDGEGSWWFDAVWSGNVHGRGDLGLWWFGCSGSNVTVLGSLLW